MSRMLAFGKNAGNNVVMSDSITKTNSLGAKSYSVALNVVGKRSAKISAKMSAERSGKTEPMSPKASETPESVPTAGQRAPEVEEVPHAPSACVHIESQPNSRQA